ncbi:MAG: hypothetical protein Q9169_000813 [Polycauliona sp. 2 TL-2023]
MSNGPLPTRLILLSDLPTCAHGEKLLLETLTWTDTQVGEWVNVMGYVQSPEEGKGGKANRAKHGGGKDGGERKVIKFQAVMLWSAGGINLWEYEKALEMRKKVDALAE